MMFDFESLKIVDTLPPDGTLDVWNIKPVTSDLNLMIIKVPETLKSAEESPIELATIDRSIPGTDVKGNRIIDKLHPNLPKVKTFERPLSEDDSDEPPPLRRIFSMEEFKKQYREGSNTGRRSRASYRNRNKSEEMHNRIADNIHPWSDGRFPNATTFSPEVQNDRPLPFSCAPRENYPVMPEYLNPIDAQPHNYSGTFGEGLLRPPDDFGDGPSRPHYSNRPILLPHPRGSYKHYPPPPNFRRNNNCIRSNGPSNGSYQEKQSNTEGETNRPILLPHRRGSYKHHPPPNFRRNNNCTRSDGPSNGSYQEIQSNTEEDYRILAPRNEVSFNQSYPSRVQANNPRRSFHNRPSIPRAGWVKNSELDPLNLRGSSFNKKRGRRGRKIYRR